MLSGFRSGMLGRCLVGDAEHPSRLALCQNYPPENTHVDPGRCRLSPASSFLLSFIVLVILFYFILLIGL